MDHFKKKEQQTIAFTCYLFGIDRQVYYRRIRRKISKQDKAKNVILMVDAIRQSMPTIGTRKIYHLLSVFKFDYRILPPEAQLHLSL